MFKKRLTRNQKAFTLIEVVAAIAIVAVGLIAVLGTSSLGKKVLALRQDKIAAAYLLQQLMEEARSMPYSDPLNQPPKACSQMISECTPGYSIEGICAKLKNCQYEMKKENFDTGLKLKRIDISVTWDPPGWESQRETVTTMITDR